jgi:flagellar export protein FliJ
MAKRFQFRLEVVRKIREQARDVQRRVVADAVREVRGVEERMDQLTDQLRNTVELTRGEQQTQQLDVPSLRGHQFYRNWLHRRIWESDLELAEKRAKLDAERGKLGEASARLKAIEKLRDKRWVRHLTQVGREEQTSMDEVAVGGFVRRRHSIGGDGGE